MRWFALGLALTAAAAMQPPMAQATVLGFTASLAPEVSGATGSGSTTVIIDDVADTLKIHIDWTGLSGTTTVAHIHCCTAAPFTGTASVAVTPMSFPGFPGFNGTVPGFPSVLPVLPGVTAGSYDSPIIPLDETFAYTAAFLGGGTVAQAEAKLITNLIAGKAYVNVHSSTFPSGEIRGFPQLTSVPEPSSVLLLAAALLGMIPLVRRRYSADRT